MGSDGGPPLAALPNIGLASLSGGRVIYPHATPEYFAEFAAHARDLGARLIGGCCGTTPVEIAAIASAVEEERKPSAPLDVVERELVEPPSSEEPTRPSWRASCARASGSTCVELDPPLGRHLRRDARRRARAEALRQGRLRRHQRQPDGPRPRERADGRGRDRARLRHRDDPAPDPARHLDHGPRVAAARRARRGRPQRARGHRRPARGRRLPGLARRLRGRLDRPLADRLAAEPRRGLQRQGHRRADLVLPRRRGQPVGGRPRDRARALPPEDRGRRAATR